MYTSEPERYVPRGALGQAERVLAHAPTTANASAPLPRLFDPGSECFARRVTSR
jgi:hypothetical protein